MVNGDALGERLFDGFFTIDFYVAASVYGIILHTKIYMQAVCVTKAVVNGVCVLIAEPYFPVGFIASTSPLMLSCVLCRKKLPPFRYDFHF